MQKWIEGFNKELTDLHSILSPSPSMKYEKFIISHAINERKPLLWANNKLNISSQTRKWIRKFNEELTVPHPILFSSPSIKYEKLGVLHSINNLKSLILWASNRLDIGALTAKRIKGFNKELIHLDLILSSFPTQKSDKSAISHSKYYSKFLILKYIFYLTYIFDWLQKFKNFGNELTYLDSIPFPSPWLNSSKLVFSLCKIDPSLSYYLNMFKIHINTRLNILDIFGPLWTKGVSAANSETPTTLSFVAIKAHGVCVRTWGPCPY